MFDPNEQKQLQTNVAVTPKRHPFTLAKAPDTVPPHRVRERAYELYESRGRQPGQDEQDWLRAESELHKQEK